MVLRPSIRSALLLVLGTLCCWTRLAQADESTANQRRAMELYEESEERYQQGDLEHAETLLEEAYALDPNATLLYNLARVREGLGQIEGAIEGYRRFLEAAPDAPDRGAIEKRIETLEGQLDEQRKLQAVERESAPSFTATPAPASRPSPAPWIVLGAGGAALATGIALGIVSRREGKRAEDEEAFRAAVRAEDRANDFAFAANLGFVVAGVATITGVTWLSVRPRHPREARFEVRLGADGATLHGKF